MTRVKRFVPVLALAALLTAALLWLGTSAGVQAVGEPLPGTVQGIATYTYVNASVATTGTTYSGAPLAMSSGLDVSRVGVWQAADVFVTADVEPGGALTATVQMSPDQENWADLTYVYPSGSSPVTLTEQPYQVVMTADGTRLLRVPIAGEYMRVKLERVGTVTATVKATLRNN